MPILFYNVSPHEVVLVEARVVAAMARFPSQRHIFRSSVSFKMAEMETFHQNLVFGQTHFAKITISTDIIESKTFDWIEK